MQQIEIKGMTEWGRWSKGTVQTKFDHTDKQCKHKPESVLENATHKIRSDWDVKKNGSPNPGQTNLLINRLHWSSWTKLK